MRMRLVGGVLLGTLGLGSIMPVQPQSEPRVAIPVTEVGGQERKGGVDLFRVRDAILLKGGGLVIVQADAILLFSSDGRFGSFIAREGEGPGEVTAAWRVSLDEEQGVLWGFDTLLHRITGWTLQGEVLTTRRLDSAATQGLFETPYVVPLPGGTLLAARRRGDRRFYEQLISGRTPQRVLNEVSVEKDTLEFLYWGDTDTPKVIASVEDGVRMRITGAVRTSSYPPGGRKPLLALGVPGIAVGYTDSPTLQVLDRSGVQVREIRVPITPVPASREYLDSLGREFLAPGQAAFMGIHQEVSLRRRALSLAPRPDWRPLFEEANWDREGGLWIKESELSGSMANWIVMRKDGGFTRIQLPSGVRFLDAAYNRLAGLVRDELDVESVVVYEIPGLGVARQAYH